MAAALSPLIRQILDHPDFFRARESFFLRVLHGQVEDAYEDSDFLTDDIEMLGLDSEDDVEDLAEAVAKAISSDAEELAQAWKDETTDADRVVAAFAELRGQGIAAELYVDWGDLGAHDADHGGALIWVNTWENLSHEKVRDLHIAYVGAHDNDDEVRDAVTAALSRNGLSPTVERDGIVTVPVVWKWHVAGYGSMYGVAGED